MKTVMKTLFFCLPVFALAYGMTHATNVNDFIGGWAVGFGTPFAIANLVCSVVTMKKHVTITIDPQLLKQAKIQAAWYDTNLSALIEQLLRQYLANIGGKQHEDND